MAIKGNSKKKEVVSTAVAEMEDPDQSKLAKMLHGDVLETFRANYQKFTEVQLRSAAEILSHNDVIVESPTGSGKTLAFLLPTLTLMRKRVDQWKASEVGALVLSPSRELAMQITEVAKPFVEKLGYLMKISTGGSKNKPEEDLELLKKGCNVLIATPGRLEHLLTLDKDRTLRRMLKSVEVLIIDEADRFTEAAFSTSMNEILSAVPKQRRTGLFSATQAKQRDDLIKFSLRSPVTIKLREQAELVCPSTLKNYFTVCDAKLKLITLLEFIRNKSDKKFIVFLSSCQCVAYFAQFFNRLLKKRPLFTVHGKKMDQSRHREIDEFRKSSNGVMLCTDLMSRGIDIQDIDWVVQFDVPRNSSWFVHRAGRTARCGREGAALLLLTTQEIAYVQFVEKYEKVKLEEVKVKTVTELKGKQLMEQLRKFAVQDREILLSGTKAFVSFIEAYHRHDCHIVCPLKDLDVVGLAHAYGLLRLPKMGELSGRTDLQTFERSDVDTSEIKFLNATKEKKRSEMQGKKMTLKTERKKVAFEKREKREAKAAKRKSTESGGEQPEKKKKRTIKETDEATLKNPKAKKEKGNVEGDMDDYALLRKMKKGRLSKDDIKILD